MDKEEFKKALGKTAALMTEEQINNLMATLDYLTDKWLDAIEISTFGKTIEDLTKGKYYD